MHLKRQRVPKNWPIHRKGTKYIVRPKSALEAGVPLLIVLRDMLHIAQNRKEVKKAIFLKQILVNKNLPKDEKKIIFLFDTISLISSEKYYKLDLTEKGKFELVKITADESNKKAVKIVDKKVLKGKKVQLNLNDGRNLISNIDCKINDSLLLNLKEKKAEKCLPLKQGALIAVFLGKHAGKRGEIKSIDLEKKIVEFESNKEKLNVLIKQIVVIR